ncbi:MAG: ParA family protein, partial [Hyphomicrobiales bacterium]
VDGLAGQTDYLILDLEGTANQAVTYALSRADLALIPLEPNAVEGPHAARAVSLIRRTGHMLNREIPYNLVLNRCNAAFETAEERALRREISNVDVQALPVVLVRRAAFTKIFGEASLLSELQKSAGDQRERDRLVRAIANARAYAHSVVDALREKAAA